MEMNKQQLRERIIRRLEKMASELLQTIQDKEWWNENRLDAAPFDIGWDRVMLQCVCGQLVAWQKDDMESVKEWSERMSEVAERNGGVQ